MSKFCDQIRGLMAQELARGEGRCPLVDGEDELPNAAVTIRAINGSDFRRPLLSVCFETDDLLKCVTAIAGALNLTPGVPAELPPFLRQKIDDLRGHHEVGDNVVLTIMLGPVEPKPDVGNDTLQRDLHPVREQSVDHAPSLTESICRSKGARR